MPLQHTRNGYIFRADSKTLSIEPGPKPITLTRWELERLGLVFQDIHPITFGTEAEKEGVIGGILSSLTEALTKCRGARDAWVRRNLQRAMVLVGEMDEEEAVKILDHEGV